MLGGVLYQGPSELDGRPIVVILTGFRKSKNRKTGKMLQTWILRADRDPARAVVEGADSSVCGDCKHRRRNGGGCYVIPEQAPLSVWRAWRAGSYQDWREAFPANVLAGRQVRLGSYGDPAAVPWKVWRRVFAQDIAGWTGYTHQWRRPASQGLRNVIMASVDTPEEAEAARAAGWRYFRVDTQRTPVAGEVACPASEEAGKRATCASCNLCQGQRSGARSVSIQPHGPLMNRFGRKVIRGRPLKVAG